MKEIPLSRGKVALVDDEDYEWLNQSRWRLLSHNERYSSGPYALRSQYNPDTKRSTTIYMHRLILSAPSHLQVDHINGNGLDNRRSNLRLCLSRQNQYNYRKTKRPTTSRYKGVSWNKQKRKWEAQIQVNRKHKHLGVFGNEKDAAYCYDAGALRYFGEFARLNFPERKDDEPNTRT